MSCAKWALMHGQYPDILCILSPRKSVLRYQLKLLDGLISLIACQKKLLIEDKWNQILISCSVLFSSARVNISELFVFTHTSPSLLFI